MMSKVFSIDLYTQEAGNKDFDDDFQIYWKDIKYTVKNSLLTRAIKRLQGLKEVSKSKEILHGINGSIKCGELMAFMGPSGCGKSTLLECIVGKRVKGKTGDALLFGQNLEKISVSFIPQRNDFLNKLTVRETIMFATKLQIANKLNDRTLEYLHDENGKIILTKLGGKEYCSI
ncbi:ABC transporter G family member 22-like protein, partial [Leptotrombidium deliense]